MTLPREDPIADSLGKIARYDRAWSYAMALLLAVVLAIAAAVFFAVPAIFRAAHILEQNTGPAATARSRRSTTQIVCDLKTSGARSAREQSLAVDDALLARFHQPPIDPATLPPIPSCPNP